MRQRKMDTAPEGVLGVPRGSRDGTRAATWIGPRPCFPYSYIMSTRLAVSKFVRASHHICDAVRSPHMGAKTSRQDMASFTGPSFSVLTYNINDNCVSDRHPSDWSMRKQHEQLARLILQHQPDLLCLQECFSGIPANDT